MTLAVVDASVLVSFNSVGDPLRAGVVHRLSSGDAFYAPTHLDAEVLSALRSLAPDNEALRKAVPAGLRHLD